VSESQQYPYSTYLDIKFPALALGESIDLQQWQGYVVPKGAVHRTRAPDRAVILMVETTAIVPTGRRHPCFE